MKWLCVCLAMAVLPMLGAHKGAELPPIALYTQFSEQPPADVIAAMREEVNSIMAPMDLRFQWLDLSSSDGKQTSVELAVIDFKGRCDVNGLSPRDINPGPLGWTHMSDGMILPFAEVDCSAVRHFIQRELLESRAEGRARALGRALGRVLAHELYHIFANTTHHGADGVGREYYNAHDLMSSNFQFEARESMALINSKIHSNLTNAAVPDCDAVDRRD
ncbi:MAG: hypothetical protein WDO73_38085 [Ignavibacteriota bacterium]